VLDQVEAQPRVDESAVGGQHDGSRPERRIGEDVLIVCESRAVAAGPAVLEPPGEAAVDLVEAAVVGESVDLLAAVVERVILSAVVEGDAARTACLEGVERPVEDELTRL